MTLSALLRLASHASPNSLLLRVYEGAEGSPGGGRNQRSHIYSLHPAGRDRGGPPTSVPGPLCTNEKRATQAISGTQQVPGNFSLAMIYTLSRHIFLLMLRLVRSTATSSATTLATSMSWRAVCSTLHSPASSLQPSGSLSTWP